MSDIITRLLLKTNDFDANLENSKKNVSGFQNKITSMSSVAGAGIMKFVGVIGVAVTVSEGFNKIMNSSQTLGDEYARTMDGLKGGVDQFFYSIGNGDWTPFMNGLTETIRLACEASDAMDQLGNTKMSFSYFDAKNQAIVQEQITILKDKDSTEEQKKVARELLEKTLKDQEEIVGQYKRRSQNAVQAMVKAAIGLDGVDVSAIDIDKVLRLDVSSAGDKQKAQLAKQYRDFVDEYDRLKAKYTTYGTVGFGMNVHTVANTDMESLGKAISPMLAKYQDAIQYNAILVKKSDEWLQNLINVATAAEAADRSLSSMTKASNRASQSGTGGKTPKEEAKEGSIGWYDAQISAQNKELIAATDMQARSTIQATINELEQKKINLKFVVDQEAFKIKNGGMKDGALSVPIAPAYDKVPTHGKGGKNFKLPKYNPLFKKEDVDLNEDYADSLSAIGSVMSALNGVTNESAASYLQWGANVISSIAQAIPAILSLTTAKTAEAAANSANSAAQIPFVGWLAAAGAALSVVAAMASIPKFATGGIVPGASFTGDKVPALLNSGEMILNGSQQSNLFKMLNSGLYGSLSQKIAPSIEDQNVRLYSDVEIRGDRIFLALHNHIKKTGKKLW